MCTPSRTLECGPIKRGQGNLVPRGQVIGSHIRDSSYLWLAVGSLISG